MALTLRYAALATCALLTIGASAAKAVDAKLIPGVHPVLISETNDSALLLGGLVNGKWYTAGRTARYVRENQKYKIYDDTKCTGEITGSKVSREANWYLIKVTGLDKEFDIGIAGDWNVFPRAPQPDSLTNADYVKAVRAILDQKKMTKSSVNITRAQSVDIQGDGKKATLITAESKTYNTKVRAKGEYSMALLYINGTSHLLKGEFHLANRKESYPESYSIAGLWDIDGDKALEIGVGIAVPKADAAGIAVYKWTGGKLKLLGKAIKGH